MDEVAGQQKDVVSQVHANVGPPVAFELPAGGGVLAVGEMAFPLFPCEAAYTSA